MDGTQIPGRGGSAAVPDAAPSGADIRDEDFDGEDFEDFDAWLATSRKRPTTRAFGMRLSAPPVISVRAAARWQQMQSAQENEPITGEGLAEFLDLLYSRDGLGEQLLAGGADYDGLLALVIWGFRNGRGDTISLAECYRRIQNPPAVRQGKAQTPGDESDASGESS